MTLGNIIAFIGLIAFAASIIWYMTRSKRKGTGSGGGADHDSQPNDQVFTKPSKRK